MKRVSLFNQHWHRVRDLMPALAPDVEVNRQVFRLQPHYILRRRSTRRWHRLSAFAYEFIARLNGRCTVDEAWQSLLATQGEQAPDQSDIISLLSELHEADLLVIDSELDIQKLADRDQQRRLRERKQRFWNPLHIRIALLDPDALLTRLDKIVPRRCLAPMVAALLVLLVFIGIALLPKWQLLSSQLSANHVFDPANLVWMVCLYPIMKLLHELAHALVIKRYGGEVRESGIAFLVLMPNPYVDASAAIMFCNKYQRMLVSFAGILVELSIAALATIVWLNSEGLVRDAALSVVILGTISTLVFNGNPLLKFDAYYMLVDWLEIPNLAARSRQYVLACLASSVGLEPATRISPVDSRERLWLIGYGVLSMSYKLALIGFIAWTLSKEFFFFGLLIAIYALFVSFVVPVYKSVCFVVRQSASAQMRFYATLVVCTSLVGFLLLNLRLPGIVVTDGIVWLPEQSQLRLEQSCEVVKVYASPGTTVKKGERLFDCAEEYWLAEQRTTAAQLQHLDAERTGLLIKDHGKYTTLSNERLALVDQLSLAQQRLSSMHVTAPASGEFVLDGTAVLQGRFIPANTIAAYIVPAHERTIRLALTQLQAARIDRDRAHIEVYARSAGGQARQLSTRIAQMTPKATKELSVLALTTLGGGRLRAEPLDDGGVLEQAMFDVELEWPANMPAQHIGSRLSVRIEHTALPFGRRIADQLRQLWQTRTPV